MDPIHPESQDESVIQLQNPLDEVLDIPDDVFINNEGVPPPRTKRRGDVLDFGQKIRQRGLRSREKAFEAETITFKLDKALIQNTNDNNVADFMKSITETLIRIEVEFKSTNRKIESMDRKIESMDRKIGDMDRKVDGLKSDVAEIKPLMFYVQTSENARRRQARLPPIPVPFLVGTGPGGDLPIITSVETIDSLNLGQLRRFLIGYGVQHSSRASSKVLKSKLREALGFYEALDLSFEFS